MTDAKSINIAILAMGGEGGGVLSDWLVHTAEKRGYFVQTTSVPGVAQRTGATIYYLELFPQKAIDERGELPVLGLMPMPGDIDLAVASELMEAGRAIQRGLVTPDRTHLVASTHRVYSMTERTALGDGRVDSDAIVAGCTSAALSFKGFDMAELAEENRSVISAVLLGAIAGSKALPFSPEDYSDAIKAGGVSVSNSLAAFAAGLAAAVAPFPMPDGKPKREPFRKSDDLSATVRKRFSGKTQTIILAGIDRTTDYQDENYAKEYHDRLRPFMAVAEGGGDDGQELLSEVARQLALGMTYEDTIRVAELKIRGSRFERVHSEVGAGPGQIVEIVEFMHPRIEEIADTLPAGIGGWLLRSSSARFILAKLTSRGRMVRTTSIPGFLLLYFLTSMKTIRRSTLRFRRETDFLTEWLEMVRGAALINIALATGLAQLRNLVKGYGDTYERGLSKYEKIREIVLRDIRAPATTENLMAFIAAAQRDEHGEALDLEIQGRSPPRLAARS